MNLLRNVSFCNVLNLYNRRSGLMSLSFIPLHNDIKIQMHGISAYTKTKSIINLNNCPRDLDIFRRSINNYQPISHSGNWLTKLKGDLNPYARLIRFDRPIG